MAAEPNAARVRRSRSPSNFVILKKVEDREGQPTFVQVGEELGLSAKGALEKAMATGALDGVALGDELAVVNEKQFKVKPAKISF